MTNQMISAAFLNSESQVGTAYAVMLVLLIAVLVIFFLIPDRRRRRALNEMRAGLKQGDRVVTQAGIHGMVLSVSESTVILEVGNTKTQLEVALWGIESLEGQGKKKGFLRDVDVSRK